jgi:hypothetical protein
LFGNKNSGPYHGRAARVCPVGSLKIQNNFHRYQNDKAPQIISMLLETDFPERGLQDGPWALNSGTTLAFYSTNTYIQNIQKENHEIFTQVHGTKGRDKPFLYHRRGRADNRRPIADPVHPSRKRRY